MNLGFNDQCSIIISSIPQKTRKMFRFNSRRNKILIISLFQCKADQYCMRSMQNVYNAFCSYSTSSITRIQKHKYVVKCLVESLKQNQMDILLHFVAKLHQSFPSKISVSDPQNEPLRRKLCINDCCACLCKSERQGDIHTLYFRHEHLI